MKAVRDSSLSSSQYGYYKPLFLAIKMERVQVLSNLFDQKTVKILEKLLVKKDVFYLRELSKDSGVSLATTYRIVQKLLSMGLAEKTLQGKFTIYKLNKDSPIFLEIHTLIIGKKDDHIDLLKNNLREQFPSQPLLIYILKGNKKIFVIGNVEPDYIRNLTKLIKDKTGNKLDLLSISSDQFSKMQDMGLIGPGKAESIN